MNFTSEMEGKDIQVELKYCERCGGLWLRPQGTEGAYCAPCRAHLEARPDPGDAPPRERRRRKTRVRKAESAALEVHSLDWIERLEGVAATELRV